MLDSENSNRSAAAEPVVAYVKEANYEAQDGNKKAERHSSALLCPGLSSEELPFNLCLRLNSFHLIYGYFFITITNSFKRAID